MHAHTRNCIFTLENWFPSSYYACIHAKLHIYIRKLVFKLFLCMYTREIAYLHWKIGTQTVFMHDIVYTRNCIFTLGNWFSSCFYACIHAKLCIYTRKLVFKLFLCMYTCKFLRNIWKIKWNDRWNDRWKMIAPLNFFEKCQ